MPKKLMRSVHEGKRPLPSLKRRMIKIIGERIHQSCRSPGRKSLAIIARKIVSKYPDSFADKLCNEVMAEGIDSILKQLVNKIENLNRGPSTSSKRQAPKDVAKDVNTKKRKNFDYGCTN